jgi:CubicO group peptidase (beta-lactamase class C family)
MTGTLPVLLSLALMAAPATPGPRRAPGPTCPTEVRCAPPPASLDTLAIDRAVQEEMAATRTPGVAIAIVQGDRIVYEKGYGVRSIETRAPVEPTTLFRLGSTTKMVTGLTASLLAREGKLQLTAPISRVAPGLDPALGAVTLHQLLTHRAGLVNEASADGPHDEAALERRVQGWGRNSLLGPPGDVYSYSGPGYWLAGHVIARAAGVAYADAVATRVLRPLGMTRSTFRPLEAMTWPLALDHRVGEGGARVVRPFPDDVTTWASGSLFSSAHEMARFAIAVLGMGAIDGDQVLPAEAVAPLHALQTTSPGGCGYSYGLAVCERGGERSLSHYGFRSGTGSVVSMRAKSRVAVIILANRNGGIFARTERAIFAQLLPGASQDDAPSPPTERPTADEVPGVYASGPDTLRVSRGADGAWRYRYGANESAARWDAAAGTLEVLGAKGEVVQQFLLVRGAVSRRWYLHDGLSAFARAGAAPPRQAPR